MDLVTKEKCQKERQQFHLLMKMLMKKNKSEIEGGKKKGNKPATKTSFHDLIIACNNQQDV